VFGWEGGAVGGKREREGGGWWRRIEGRGREEKDREAGGRLED
jgi:hypothetical protein